MDHANSSPQNPGPAALDGFPPEVSKRSDKQLNPCLPTCFPFWQCQSSRCRCRAAVGLRKTNIFVLACSHGGPVCITVEGKVNESFGPTLCTWVAETSPGKDERLGFLLRTLCISAVPDGASRYQLLHRAACAIITGEQYHAVAAIVLVHSFSEERTGWLDYESFVRLFGAQAVSDAVQRPPSESSIPLLAACMTSDFSFLKS